MLPAALGAAGMGASRLSPFLLQQLPKIMPLLMRGLQSPAAQFAVKNKQFLDPAVSLIGGGLPQLLGRQFNSNPMDNPNPFDYLFGPVGNAATGMGYRSLPLGIGQKLGGIAGRGLPTPPSPYLGKGWSQANKSFLPLSDTAMKFGTAAGSGTAFDLLFKAMGVAGTPPPEMQPSGAPSTGSPQSSMSGQEQNPFAGISPEEKEMLLYYLQNS